jgi:hypothetical protein
VWSKRPDPISSFLLQQLRVSTFSAISSNVKRRRSFKVDDGADELLRKITVGPYLNGPGHDMGTAGRDLVGSTNGAICVPIEIATASLPQMGGRFAQQRGQSLALRKVARVPFGHSHLDEEQVLLFEIRDFAQVHSMISDECFEFFALLPQRGFRYRALSAL